MAFMLFAVLLEGPHNPPPIVGCLAWLWFVTPQIPAAIFSFSRSFIDLAGAVFVSGLFVVGVVPRDRLHKSSKFAEVACLAGVGEVVVPGTKPGVRTPPRWRGEEVTDIIEALIL